LSGNSGFCLSHIFEQMIPPTKYDVVGEHTLHKAIQ